MNKLAILGGTPINAEPPTYIRWPVAGDVDREAILRVLRSGVWGTLGPENKAFSEEYAAYCHVRHALPVVNGTVSLELILRALGIGRGDDVILPPYTFTASATSIAMVGAMPVFADIEPDTYTISAKSCERVVTPHTRAVIGVHLGGYPFDVDALKRFADRHGLYLIEDAAHAHGSEWRGRRAGSLGCAGSFSFQGSKNLNCGEGGCVTTNDSALYETLWSLHHNGRRFGDGSFAPPYLGTNARLAEWQCALLRARMLRVDADIDRRMENAAYLDKQLSQFPFFLPMKNDERITRNALHLYVFRYRSEGLKDLPRAAFVKALRAENVCDIANGYSTPIYDMEFLRTEAFQKATGSSFAPPSLENRKVNEHAAHAEGCWICHSSLLGTRSDMDRIIEAFARIADQADAIKKALTREE